MKNVPVSNGELLDKLSVLEIKKDKGLQVDKELKLLKTEAKDLNEIREVAFLYNILISINNQLWDIEDAKREHERQQSFGADFERVARLVYMINDERAKVKKYIDRMSGSVITEEKSHRSY